EQDKHRRLQSIQDWKENFESGKHYFELRSYLSESQRLEIDDSLRMSLTARQLQFNSKNVAHVFEALSTAGGRFATLIEFAKRNIAKSGTTPKEAGGGAPEAERETKHDKASLGVSARELAPQTPDISFVQNQEAEELSREAGNVPALSIKNVFLEENP